MKEADDPGGGGEGRHRGGAQTDGDRGYQHWVFGGGGAVVRTEEEEETVEQAPFLSFVAGSRPPPHTACLVPPSPSRSGIEAPVMATLRPAAAEKEAVVGETAAATIRWIEGGIFSGRRRFRVQPVRNGKSYFGCCTILLWVQRIYAMCNANKGCHMRKVRRAIIPPLYCSFFHSLRKFSNLKPQLSSSRQFQVQLNWNLTLMMFPTSHY